MHATYDKKRSKVRVNISQLSSSQDTVRPYIYAKLIPSMSFGANVQSRYCKDMLRELLAASVPWSSCTYVRPVLPERKF